MTLTYQTAALDQLSRQQLKGSSNEHSQEALYTDTISLDAAHACDYEICPYGMHWSIA